MKIIDKYILRTFLLPLIFTVIGFLMIMVLYDLADNLDRFIQAGASWGDVGKYYAFLLPSRMWVIMPMSMLLSTLYSLFQLTKHNELTAMRASGISMYRILVPNIILGLAVAVGIFVVNETIGPRFSNYCAKFVDSLKSSDRTGKGILELVVYETDSGNRTWIAESISTSKDDDYKITAPVIKQKAVAGKSAYTLEASHAYYQEDQWIFKSGKVMKLGENDKVVYTETFEKWVLNQVKETPKDIIRRVRDDKLKIGGGRRSSISFKSQASGNVWTARSMIKNPNNYYILEGVAVRRKTANMIPEFKLTAERAEYRNGKWWFIRGQEVTYDPADQSPDTETFAMREFPRFKESPDIFVKEEREIAYMTIYELYTFYQNNRDKLEPMERTTYITEMLIRVSRPFMCFVAPLLGMPFGFYTARKGVFTGIISCLSAVFLYYGMVIMGDALARGEHLAPIIGAWAPNLIFLCIGALLFYRMRA